MIIVFADDHTVAVLPDIVSVRRECEAVDEENGVYCFFDELGRRLVPRFIAPVQRKSLFFGVLKSVGGGDFELELDPQPQGPAFETSLANVVAIDQNPRFATVADLARHVAENRRRELGI
ncbi:MAG TPA: hypothetical protein VE135_20920 [Pyrinomonadaceae bacterium]|nr:hypothetical protein [Pyrinomonadaceae bacterium]